jgi:PLP dependent protein
MHDATIDTTGHKLADIQQQIAAAAKLARREPSDIQLIAVSKTRTPSEIESLLRAGQRTFGENRVQETADKWPELRGRYADVKLHLIGQLQSNKADEAVALFDIIHSVDRISLVNALGKAMKAQAKQVPCFLQVNIGAELQKGGCEVDELPALLAAAQAQHIHVAGLMCLPPADIEPAPFFALLAELAARNGLGGLSMGMSGDFPTAIMLGATHIRVGTALFGARA